MHRRSTRNSRAGSAAGCSIGRDDGLGCGRPRPAEEVGIEAVQQGHTGTGIRFAYVDTDDHPGGMIELIEAGPAITGFFKLVRDAAQGWDGSEPIRRMR